MLFDPHLFMLTLCSTFSYCCEYFVSLLLPIFVQSSFFISIVRSLRKSIEVSPLKVTDASQVRSWCWRCSGLCFPFSSLYKESSAVSFHQDMKMHFFNRRLTSLHVVLQLNQRSAISCSFISSLYECRICTAVTPVWLVTSFVSAFRSYERN